MKKIWSGCFITAILLFTSCMGKTVMAPQIIPQPVHMTPGNGNFRLHSHDKINYTGGEGASGVANYLAALLQPATGFTVRTGTGNRGAINLVIDTTLRWQPEEYSLVVKRRRITLTGGTPAGLFRGVQTIRQLLPPEIEADSIVTGIKWEMPCVEITDFPRFAWRGMHLDVSRHFFDVEFVKRYIDLIAFHKMNTFHWHLVDDQGWRIEIKKYPRLTETGGWRVDHEDQSWRGRQPQQPGEKATYGGFYTQEEIKEVVAYAAERHINVVPEIEMPAHVGSALAAYPEFSCTGGPFTVPPGGVWPIVNIYCAGKEETFKFIEDVLTEVMELFPSPYIHIGGDEADKTEWRKCPLCQERIRKEGLKDEAGLQSYFMKRIEKFLSSKGRILIGWDEILEGGLAPGATVMSWRGFEGGIAAAKSGHYVVMSPVSHCYFDYYQGDPSTEPVAFGGYTTLKKVYNFEPVPGELTPQEARFIMGAQANLWTEMISNGRHAEYMVLPRMTALSEVLWSAPESKDWNSFNERLKTMERRFDIMGLNYSRGTYRVEMSVSFDKASNKTTLTLASEQLSPEIRYTTDGSDPSMTSPIYEEPITISETGTVRAAIFVDGKVMGRISEKRIRLSKATGCNVKYNTLYNSKYKTAGEMALVDGINGSGNFNDGYWQGFEGTDLDVTIDLGAMTSFKTVTADFIAATGNWVFLPQWVDFSCSADSMTFTTLGRTVNNIAPAKQGNQRSEVSWSGEEKQARYIRIIAKNLGLCPQWHTGKGGKAWLFADEVLVE